jgi:hypothetical protein
VAILVRASIAAIVVGVLGLTSILLFALLGNGSQGRPVPIAQPITPDGFPYSSLAVLRKQRMSNDVLPSKALASMNGLEPTIVAASARLLVKDGNDEYFVAVDTKNQVCILSVSTVSADYVSGCSEGIPVDSGTMMNRTEFGSHVGFSIIADGAPVRGAVPTGYRKIQPDVWMTTHSY